MRYFSSLGGSTPQLALDNQSCRFILINPTMIDSQLPLLIPSCHPFQKCIESHLRHLPSYPGDHYPKFAAPLYGAQLMIHST